MHPTKWVNWSFFLSNQNKPKMKISLNHIGSYGGEPATIIEVIIDLGNATIVETISNCLDNKVESDIILNLREIADELEEHNNKIDHD